VDGVGHGRDVGVGGDHRVDTELAQSAFALLVIARRHADDGDACRGDPAQHVTVEAAEVGGEEYGPAVPGCDRGQHVGHVDTTPCDGHTAATGLEGGDEPRLPLRSRDSREDGNGHRDVSGTRTR
jgi:hypothetical protein